MRIPLILASQQSRLNVVPYALKRTSEQIQLPERRTVKERGLFFYVQRLSSVSSNAIVNLDCTLLLLESCPSSSLLILLYSQNRWVKCVIETRRRSLFQAINATLADYYADLSFFAVFTSKYICGESNDKLYIFRCNRSEIWQIL